MHKLFFLLLLISASVHAQLDRLKAGMTEAEFVKLYPEAIRDFEREAAWVGQPDTLFGTAGNSQWRIFKDTVSVYRFASERVAGPSPQFRLYDSTAVHKLRVSADSIRIKLERSLGKPAALSSMGFTTPKLLATGIYYLAEWNFGNDLIRVSIADDPSAENLMNAPNADVLSVRPASEFYELRIVITAANPFTARNYSIGVSSKQLVMKHPAFAETIAGYQQYHYYTIPDTLFSDNAGWNFYFQRGAFLVMSYEAWIGTAYGATSMEACYPPVKMKVEDLLKQGNANFGTPDSLSKDLPKKYSRRDRHLSYNETKCYSRWKVNQRPVVLEVTERGGGKNQGDHYHISLFFEAIGPTD
jgi:hypothetical protein